MTNRFFRNAVGVAALTSLALGLACSGSSDPDPVAPPATVNKPGTPIVSISGLTASNTAITKHQYLISASDPSGLATSFSISGSPAGSTFKEISKGMWTYIPATAGNEIITVKATNSGGTSDGGGVMASVVNNQEPSYSKGTTVPVGGERSVSLPASDGDGDTVTWVVGTAPTGLTAAINGSSLLITADKDAEAKEYKLPLTYTEKHPTVGYTVETKTFDFTVTVSVGGSTGGGDGTFDWHQGDTRGQVHAFPNNMDEAGYGVPFTFQFNAGDPFVPTNKITAWHVNGGLSPFNADGENAPPPISWIGQPQDSSLLYMRPAINSLGDAFERWRLGIDFQTGKSNNRLENFPSGRLYFVAQDQFDEEDEPTYTYHPDTYSSRTLFGVRADFSNDNVLAYQDFYVRVSENTAPVLPAGTYNSKPLTITVLNKRATDPRADANVPAEVPWAGKSGGGTAVKGVGAKYTGESRLVFRHENDNYSYDMAASMDLSSVRFNDPDVKKYGDVILFRLDGVTYGDNRERQYGGLGTDYAASVPANPGVGRPGDVDYVPSSPAIPAVPYSDTARKWIAYNANGSVNTANSLRNSQWDVTNVVRPLLARPYPVEGKDLDASRLFDGIVYLSGVDDDNFEDGKKQSIYQYHKDGLNNRGNLLALTTTGAYVYPSDLTFVRVPKLSEFKTAKGGLREDGINGSEGLTFHYTAIDLGGNETIFQIYVPTRANWAPQLDQYYWTDPLENGIDPEEEEDDFDLTHGDVRGSRFNIPAPGVWATSQPAEGEKNSWGFVWKNSGSGVVPARYYIADRPYTGVSSSTSYGNGVYNALASQASADPVFLMIPPAESTDGSMNVDNYGGMNNPIKTTSSTTSMHGAATNFSFEWTPTLNQGRKNYAYTIYGWDKYGAGMRPFPMHGKVFGSLEGEPIRKMLYNDGAVVAAGPADLTINGNARVSVNPFFDNSFPPENRLANQYGMDTDQPWLSINQQGTSAPWRVSHVPPKTNLLVSAARSSAGDHNVIEDPVIGPSVLSLDGARYGTNFFSFESKVSDGGGGYKYGGAPLASEKAAVYPTNSWETGNLISYAYINPMAAEDAEALTDPSKRLRVDLTTHVGSGQIALATDTSLNLLGADGKTVFNEIEMTEPEFWGWNTTKGLAAAKNPSANLKFDYYGLMYGVGAASISEDGVVQVVMPSVGQTAFFHIQDPGANLFPSAKYPDHLGWFKTPLKADSFKYANLDQNFEPIVLPVFPFDANYADYSKFATGATSAPAYATGLPYKFHIGEDGTPNYTMVTLKRSGPNSTGYTAPTGGATGTLANMSVWSIQKTGVPTELKSKSLLNFDNLLSHYDPDDAAADVDDIVWDEVVNKLQHESRWGDLSTDKFGTFAATVRRGNFEAWLDRLVSRGATSTTRVNRADVVDTLQVVSYVSGTSLGPVDNHQGLPVYLEFGDLNHYASSGGGVGIFNGTYSMGNYDIYKPEPKMWHTEIGGENNLGAPVVSYIARYTDRYTSLKGTMGLMTDVLTGGVDVPSGFEPIKNVKITGYKAGTAAAAANLAIANAAPAEYDRRAINNATTRRGTAVSSYISSYYDANNNVVNSADAPIEVKAYNDDGYDNYKVWLTWQNPANATTAGLSNHDKPNISGNIIEFFNAADFGAGQANDSALPIYKVFVGPSINAFPIPDAWLPYLGFQPGGSEFDPVTGAPTNVVARIRTVRYGDKTKGTFVNFDESPFKQALPAVWMDTLTTKLDFRNVGSDAIDLESEYKFGGFKKNGQTYTWTPVATASALAATYTKKIDDVVAAAGTITLASLANDKDDITFNGTSPTMTGKSAGITWRTELIPGSVTGAFVDNSKPGDLNVTLGEPDYTKLEAANKITAAIVDGQAGLQITVDPVALEQAQPAAATRDENDTGRITFKLLMEATYAPAGLNPRSTSREITVNLTKTYGNWGGFKNGGNITFTPATANPTVTDSVVAANLAAFATTPAKAINTAVAFSNVTDVTNANLTAKWEVGNSISNDIKVSGMGRTNVTVPAGATLAPGTATVAPGSLTPTLTINDGAIQTALTGGNWDAGNITVKVPATATFVYSGRDNSGPARTATWEGDITANIAVALSDIWGGWAATDPGTWQTSPSPTVNATTTVALTAIPINIGSPLITQNGSITANGGTPDWAWTIDTPGVKGAVATTGGTPGTLTGNDPTVTLTGDTGTGSAVGTPTVTLNIDQYMSNPGVGNVWTITIPLKLSVTYHGNPAGSTARTHTATQVVTVTVTGPT